MHHGEEVVGPVGQAARAAIAVADELQRADARGRAPRPPRPPRPTPTWRWPHSRARNGSAPRRCAGCGRRPAWPASAKALLLRKSPARGRLARTAAATSGSPACVARTMRSSSGAHATQPQLHEVLLQARQLQHRVAGFLPRSPPRSFAMSASDAGREHEPHVEAMLALVVVRDLGVRVDERRDALEIGRRHAHRAQREGAAQPLGVVHRPEARQHAARREESGFFPRGPILRSPNSLATAANGRVAERKAALQAVDDGAVDVIHSGRRAG